MACKKLSKPNTPSPDIAGSSTPSLHTTSTSLRNIASTPTSLNTNTTAPFRHVISQDILASLSQTQSQSQRTSNIIKRYPNINVPKSYRSHHEEKAPRNVRPSNEEAGNLELENLKNETFQLQNELNQEKVKVSEMKRKIDNLQDRVYRVKEKNSLLRQFNKIFGDELNQLCEENKTLQEELQWLKQLHTPRKTIDSPQQYLPKRPNKRLKLREKLPDEVAASAARKKNRRVKAAIKLYERNDTNIKEFYKDELLLMLVQNDYHSIEQSDSEDDSRQKLPDNKRFLHIYDQSWHSDELKQLLRDVLDPEAEYIQCAKKQQERIYNDDIYFMSNETNEIIGISEYDDMVDDLIQSYEDRVPIEPNLTEPYSDFLLNSAEMNSTRPEDLDEIGESSTTVWKKWTELFQRSRTPLGADYDISKYGTPLEANYDILKIQTFHFEDWILFEDLVTIFEDYFEGPDEAWTSFKDPGRQNTVHLSKVCGWIPRRNFKGLGLSRKLRNFKGLQLLDEDFEGLWFSLGAIIFSHFDTFY
ncbi:hypothetical protein GLOIN_2v1786037 [Rhizophagus clarus]|uniref:Uncharacterized protein n=1 Tax=Rhizophagus clarus TaxID=94130 RepID=A0A8H3LCS0_9GLOM|nr:hypothetical protein GLOIN_2v1786037 [Rhizophagus clarus]